MPRVNWRDLSRYPVALPPEQVADTFTSLVQPLIQAINSHIMQSRTLAAMRDALLPKLLSGEIRVRDTERFAEVASSS
jgi:type I restriction enzyme S subunit